MKLEEKFSNLIKKIKEKSKYATTLVYITIGVGAAVISTRYLYYGYILKKVGDSMQEAAGGRRTRSAVLLLLPPCNIRVI